jgi:hypothetical protein
MVNFTTLINRARQRHVDKNLKKRVFGECDACEKWGLLIHYKELYSDARWILCEHCYNMLVDDEIK